ncbi:MAG TPA: hypothetical protein VFK05_07925 [Polyangiaceae bacterium]|nr:hypothetical protein [Polyangiaceae bacterium]
MRSTDESLSRKIGLLAPLLGGLWLVVPRSARAAEIDWKGYTWSVTNGGMAGVAAGSSANVSVDASGYLHLKVRKNGDTWTAAEIFSTARLGFGTYQWQIDGPIDTLDKNVVLGLFPYGPAANIGGDGTNEIDIEYSRWGQANGPNGDWTNYPASGKTVGELSYTFSLMGQTLSTSRFIWTASSIEDFLLAGLEPVSSTNSLLKSWKYAPDNPKTNIPQQALPLGMNLWCFDLPSDGKNVEIVVRDFQFVPEGASAGGAAGAGGVTGGGAGGAGGGVAGPGGGSAEMGGSAALGGSSALGGSTGSSAASGNGSPAGAIGVGGTASPGAETAGGAGTAPGSAGSSAGHNSEGLSGSTEGRESGHCSVGLAPRAPGTDVPWWCALLLLSRTRRRRSD